MTNQVNIVGITGHRKLEHNIDVVKEVIREKLHQYEADAVVTGMALGFDMLVAEVCIEENIPFVAAIPCSGQTKSWNPKEKARYMQLVDKAWKTKVVCEGPFAIWKLFERNRWIVNRSTIILSYWNGIEKGGTAAAVKEAKKMGRPHENLFSLCRTK